MKSVGPWTENVKGGRSRAATLEAAALHIERDRKSLQAFCERLKKEEAERRERLRKMEWPDYENLPLGVR